MATQVKAREDVTEDQDSGEADTGVVLAPRPWGHPFLDPQLTAWVIMANRPDPMKAK